MRLLVTFFSVSAALYAQKLLDGRETRCAVVPVPRRVSSSCGYALDVSEISASALADTMNGAGIEWEAVYRQTAEGKDECYERVLSCSGEGMENG